MRRRHAKSPGFSGHYQDLGISKYKGVTLCRGSEISVAYLEFVGGRAFVLVGGCQLRLRLRQLPPKLIDGLLVLIRDPVHQFLVSEAGESRMINTGGDDSSESTVVFPIIPIIRVFRLKYTIGYSGAIIQGSLL